MQRRTIIRLHIAHKEKHGIVPPHRPARHRHMVGDKEVAQHIKDERDSYTPSGRKKQRSQAGIAKRGLLEAAEGQEPFMGGNMQAVAADLEKRIFEAAENLEFEEAARLRDKLVKLKA